MTRDYLLELVMRGDSLVSGAALESSLDQKEVGKLIDAVEAFKAHARSVFAFRQANDAAELVPRQMAR